MTNEDDGEGMIAVDEKRDSALGPYLRGAASLQIQSILFNNEPGDILRALESIERACELAIFEKTCNRVTVSYGDCSPNACLDPSTLETWQSRFRFAFELKYEFFGANLGSARGHNRLAEGATSEFLLIQNPDVVISPRLFGRLLSPFFAANVGMTEAKQLPIEHPKDYDRVTGETGWATTACAMIPKALFDRLDGFDSETFFLYCDDVDFSWRVREAGLKVIFNPSAIVFHDKRLSPEGAWQAGWAERYYSSEAAVLMAHKWSRPDLAKQYLDFFRHHGDDVQRRAAQAIDERIVEGRMPTPRDAEQKIATFEEHFYAKHRYPL